MTVRERILTVLNGGLPDDRLPMIEWAAWWWDATIPRWESEGLPANLGFEKSLEYFGLDQLHCVRSVPQIPPAPGHGLGVIENEDDYERLRKDMYPDYEIERMINAAKSIKPRHDSGEIGIRVWLDGFFWFPRRLFGIQPHFYAYYDYPELMHRITDDLREFNLRSMEELFKVLKPEFVAYTEDMSYNHGPMLSEQCFDEFILPHYKAMNGFIHRHKIKTLVDSDGDVTAMVPWFVKSGVDGVYPLERQANVDIVKIRGQYPEFIMLGGYDKMVMNKGENAIRTEFERILPVMKSSCYLPSVDHQTPPEVSLEDYKLYIKLFREYCEKAVK